MIIYKITNLINGKIYIGLTTKTVEQRWKNHLRCYKQTDYAIHRAIRKYGKENFKIEEIDSANDIDSLIKLESKYIEEFDSMNPLIGYNMMRLNDSIKFISEEVIEKMRHAAKEVCALRTDKEKNIISSKLSNSLQGTKRGKTSKYLGVYKTKSGTYNMMITHRGDYYRKIFKIEEHAAEAYDKFVLYLYGKNARINFPEKINEYLSLDLESFVCETLSIKNVGRPAKDGYWFNKLPNSSKDVAAKNVKKYFKENGLSNKSCLEILNMKFYYNGELFLLGEND